jgi:hypothetical protein
MVCPDEWVCGRTVRAALEDVVMQVCVTLDDIADGLIGDCYRCPVALALARATGDREANVYDDGGGIWLEVWGRVIEPPHEVWVFVREFDALPRTEDRHPNVVHVDYRQPEPFAFTVPDLDDPKWRECCSCCGDLFDPSELDDDGLCAECRDDEEES